VDCAILHLVVQANCRGQFTADDLAFVVRVLARSPHDSISLLQLLKDDEERDHILDHDLIYDQIIDHTSCIRISSAFYFYILTRRVLRKAGVEERALSDYVAAVLTAFSRINQLQEATIATPDAVPRHFAYVSDLLAALNNAEPHQAYALRSHIGNYALFLTGIFAEQVEAQAEQRGAPSIGFYETVGQSSYRTVAGYPQAQRAQLGRIYQQLAEQFHEIRMALNGMVENTIHMHAAPPILIQPG
jgi:hypothetical protein